MNLPIQKANPNAASTVGFTNDQTKAYNELISFIKSPYNPNDYKRALAGAAGTGKTYLIKSIIKNCGLSYSVIGLAAPTHKACRVLQESLDSGLNANTLQSDLGLRLNFNVENFDIKNPPFDPKGKIKIGEYKLYIVDESSMINRGLCMFLEKICKTNECKLIYVGDSYQLSPVKESYSSAFKGIKCNFLKQVVRQGDDNPITYLLELLRYDIEHKTFNFLNYVINNPYKFNDDGTKGYRLCSNSEFADLVYTNFNDEQLTKNVDYCKVLAYTNNCVSGWNKFIRNSIIKDAEKSIITNNDLIISYTTVVDQYNSCVIKNSEEYILKDVVNFPDPKTKIKGFMVRFTSIHGGVTTTPLFIVDHTDGFSLSMYVKISKDMIATATTASKNIKASLWREYYEFKENHLLLTNIGNVDGKIAYPRDLDYGFSLTTHKSQGSTFDTTFVDLNDIVYDRYGNIYTNADALNRRLYVACSRSKNKLYLKYGR